MQAFSLSECISKALASVASRAQEKSITLTSNIEPSVGQMIGNEFSINEMIANLLFNAVKYTPEQKTVRLEAKGYDDHVRIDVIDTGIGIPADELAHVFDEFFRATNALKTEKDGTGLGLSIVKQIVKQHSGEISVESREGQGSTFTVILPKDSSTPVCS
jgi:two-component system phosphate regulon sensor histidine kinase PhoR